MAPFSFCGTFDYYVSFMYNDVRKSKGGYYEATEELYYIDKLTSEKPLVADLAFPGDMSSYCIGFTDSNGIYHVYTIMLSGRNNSVSFHEQGY